jgi:integrase/recombinase XerD
MLTIYRRHKKYCEHRSEGRKYRRCRCPIWVDGFLGTNEIRKSLDTADWQKAHDRVREWEAKGQIGSQLQQEPITIEFARDEFLRELKARNLRETSIDKYRVLFRQMVAFAQESGRRYITEFDLQSLRQFRASWPNRNLSALKKLERLRAFYRFAHDSKWVCENYASKIANPKVVDRPTLPFSREEMIQILAACDRYGENRGHAGREDERRIRALVLLLRYTGMRIGDAVTLKRVRIKGE